jgi:hypothetical protein
MASIFEQSNVCGQSQILRARTRRCLRRKQIADHAEGHAWTVSGDDSGARIDNSFDFRAQLSDPLLKWCPCRFHH